MTDFGYKVLRTSKVSDRNRAAVVTMPSGPCQATVYVQGMQGPADGACFTTHFM